jgi:excisionase family DNA binding protein
VRTPAATPPPSAEFLTADEAACVLRVDRKTIYESIRHNRLPGVLRLGRTIRIRRAALLEYASDDCATRSESR